MTGLVIAEHDNRALKTTTLNTVTAAGRLGEVHLLIAGWRCGEVAENAACIQGVARVLLADAEQYRHPLAEVLTPLVLEHVEGKSHLLAPASTFGRNLLPRVAALLDVAQISDIIAIEDANTFRRLIYAGNAIATVRSSDSVKVITVRGTAFDAAAAEGGNAVIEPIAAVAAPSISAFIGQQLSASERPELTEARVVVSGGRGVGSSENFRLLEALADNLGGAVGATRAAVDAGFISNDYQVGQTGKIVAPELYVAVGISGAIQHVAGMQDSKVIVAINKDVDAPIFEISDFGLVADVNDALPDLIRALGE